MQLINILSDQATQHVVGRDTIGILCTWYREPFCHQIGPYQTFQAENEWILLVSFRVFLILKRFANYKTYPNIQVHVFPGKKVPARKPAHSSPNLGQQMIFAKVGFGSNDLSGYEAICLLTLPAHPKSIQLMSNHLIGHSGRSSPSRSCLLSGRV